MPKYCPTCLAEYKDSVKICPIDKVELVNKKPKEFEEFVDIYAASNEIEAERILTLLSDNDIIAEQNVLGISQIPVVGETHYIISVMKKDKSLARTILEQARGDGVLSDDGNFI